MLVIVEVIGAIVFAYILYLGIRKAVELYQRRPDTKDTPQ